MYKFLMMVNKLMGDTSKSEKKLADIGAKINEILGSYVGPVLLALSGAAAMYIVVLGVQYAKSESDDKRAEVKKRLINMVIGLVVMIGLTVMCMAIKWESFIQIFGYAGATPEE